MKCCGLIKGLIYNRYDIPSTRQSATSSYRIRDTSYIIFVLTIISKDTLYMSLLSCFIYSIISAFKPKPNASDISFI